jgi:oligoendopeptidase F
MDRVGNSDRRADSSPVELPYRTLQSALAIALNALIVISVPCPTVALGVEPSPPPHSWDLDSEYPDEVAWNAARASVERELEAVARRRNAPIDNPKALADLLDDVASVRGRAGHMARFALLKASMDARSDAARARQSAATALEGRVDVATSWVEGAVRRLGKQRVEVWSTADARLRSHSWRIATIFRQSGHVETEGSEALAAGLQRATEAPLDLYRALLTSDLVWPTVATHNGSRTVDFLNYSDLRRDADHEIRVRVNRAYFQRLKALEQPLGLLLVRRFEMEGDLARARGFDNGIDAFFWSDDGIPVGAYRRIFETARAHKDVALRYLKLLARMNNVPRPDLSDLYAPPPHSTLRTKASDVINDVVQAWAPLGADYQKLLADRLRQPWMDLAPNPEKDGSAGGVYWAVGGGHPYILLNFEGDLPSSESLSAAAALTMFYADIPASKRPERREEDFPVYSNAVWFAGELLYDDYLLSKARTKEQRVAILSSQLYRIWNAYFQFAVTTELADKMAHAVAKNQEISGRDISQQYLAILHTYYANPDIDIDPLFAEQWMSYPFIFDSRHILAEWAMAMAGGTDLLARIESQDSHTKATIVSPLGKSSSFTSYDLLRDAGIEIDSDAPYQALINKMNADMDLLEQELSTH